MSEPRALYLDLVGGAAGDMLLAALIDAGASFDRVCDAVGRLGLEGLELSLEDAFPAGLKAKRVDIRVDGVLADHADHGAKPDHHGRSYQEVRALIGQAKLEDEIASIAMDAFARLAEAEAQAHGTSVEAVEFHEVGADDAMADIVGVATAFVDLDIEEAVVSPVPLGRGLTRGAHGPIPLPGPATLHLLEGAPTAQTELVGETVTPTGAALIRTLATRFGPVPSMVLERVGVGAGHRSWPDRPNVVRALIGRLALRNVWNTSEDCVVEANIDDMSPEHLHALERALFAAGALDVWTQPIFMKKGRIGVLVSALVGQTVKDLVARAFFAHSTTLGARVRAVERLRCDRRIEEVETQYGRVRVKISERDGSDLIIPEHDDCDRLAQAAKVPVRTVYEAALKMAWAGRE